MTSTHHEHAEYTAELAEALDMRDVPADAVAQIVREVESHLAESGEDPVEAFGPAARYADQFAPPSRERGLLGLAVAAALLGFCGAFLIISGVFGLLDDTAQLWGLPPVGSARRRWRLRRDLRRPRGGPDGALASASSSLAHRPDRRLSRGAPRD
jgi:hypothetical protein